MKGRDHIYVSGPMTGIKNSNVPAFAAAARALRKAGYNVVNPGEYEGAASKKKNPPTWEDCLRRDLELICKKCFAIATLPGWERSKGANLEIHVAERLGMRVAPVQDFLILKETK